MKTRRIRPGRKTFSLRRVTILAVCLGFAVVAAEAAKEVNAKAKIERVSLFKNGLGFFSAAVILPEGATRITLGQLPVPAHGTFWVSYPDTVKLRGVFTDMTKVAKKVPATGMLELLQANPGQRVTLGTGDEAGEWIRGTLVGPESPAAREESPSPYRMGRGPLPRRWSPPRQSGSLVLVKTAQGVVALDGRAISRVYFKGNDITTSVPRMLQQPSLRVELAEQAHGQRLGLTYLAKGITWSPSYLIDISDPETARFSASAVIINEVADLDHVQFELVTGFPNIQFGDVNSPVAMSQNLEAFLRALTKRRSEGGGRQMMMQQQGALTGNMGGGFGELGPAPPIATYSTARKGAVSEDLFLYPLRDVSLRQGETAYFPLFTAEVPYKHIYTWDIPDMLDKAERYQRPGQGRDKPSTTDVWHSCRLTNTMDMPWTTATAEFVTRGQITGQDVCYYTAPGAETTIRLNRAMNVLADEGEVEVERRRNAARFHGYDYDQITVKGELKLWNRLQKEANLEVTKHLSGEVVTSTPPAKDTPTAKGLKRVNPRHLLIWEITLGPDEKKTLSYTYKVYIHN